MRKHTKIESKRKKSTDDTFCVPLGDFGVPWGGEAKKPKKNGVYFWEHWGSGRETLDDCWVSFCASLVKKSTRSICYLNFGGRVLGRSSDRKAELLEGKSVKMYNCHRFKPFKAFQQK